MERISVEEAAERLGISRGEVEEWLKSGALVGKQVDGRWEVDPSSLDSARQVREMQRNLAVEGYLDSGEIVDTTREEREAAEEGEQVRSEEPGQEYFRRETIDPEELNRD